MSVNDKYWCAFSKLTKVSFSFVNRVYSHFGSIEHAWNADEQELKEIQGLTCRQINSFAKERSGVNPEECLEYIQEKNIKFIHPESGDYPQSLKNIDNSPVGLFVAGDLSLCNLEKTLAVVGSRRASENGKNALRKILESFAYTDICIVSGLAEGIDTVAHKTAVENNMKTIAVIGGGFDKLYPKSNKALFEKIIDGNGAVISEYWPDSDALSWHFPVRNRLVSGLSKGVLVAEAALKSGAMITANLALEQGKELLCIPGLISNPNTTGIYKLLKTGAAIVTEPEDILNQMNWVIKKTECKSEKNDFSEFSDDEKNIIELIKKDALTTDEIVLKTGLKTEDVIVFLTKAEIIGTVKQVAGEKYIVG